MKSRLIFFLIITLSIIDLSCNSIRVQGNHANYMNVTKVIDGDTFWADDSSEEGLKIRLIGVDAPESRNVFNKVVGYYGVESKQYMTSLITGKKVRLEYDNDTLDQYGRTLAYVYLQDGTFVNAEAVKQGYAIVMIVPPNVKCAKKFIILEQRARKYNRGLWHDSNSE